MRDKRFVDASPSLSVLAAQGRRVTGKTAKERPRKDRGRKSFEHYLLGGGAGYDRPDQAEESGIFKSGGVDTLA